MLVLGMLLQGLALVIMYWAVSKELFIVLSFILGLGTAIVYPTFLSAIAGFTNPTQRAESIGIFRLWRDLGYAFGALLTIILSLFFELDFTIIFIGILTLISAFIIQFRMNK